MQMRLSMTEDEIKTAIVSYVASVYGVTIKKDHLHIEVKSKRPSGSNVLSRPRLFNMRRDEWERFEKIKFNSDVALAMRARCEEQGHEMENCCSSTFQIYEQCKWCGERR
jgi:hypothetical protein